MATATPNLFVLAIIRFLRLNPTVTGETYFGSARRFMEPPDKKNLRFRESWPDCSVLMDMAQTMVAGNSSDLARGKHKQRWLRPATNPGWYLFVLLILVAGDIQLNPGPKQVKVRFPCGVCDKPVRNNQAALCFDDCNTWSHRKCLDIPLSTYRQLGRSDDEWFCPPCSMPQITDSFFNDSTSL